MIIQLVAPIIGLFGFFFHIYYFFLIAGIICLGLDIYAFGNKQLNPLVSLILYLFGYIFIGNWTGILFGALISNLIEPVFTLLIAFGVFIMQSIKR